MAEPTGAPGLTLGISRLLGLNRADARLAAALLVVALAATALPLWRATSATAGGEIWFVVHSPSGTTRLPVERDAVYEFAGPLGTTLVEVRDGRARILDSPCPHPCRHGGWVSRPGQAAACVPNRVVLQVTGSPTGEDFDAETH